MVPSASACRANRAWSKKNRLTDVSLPERIFWWPVASTASSFPTSLLRPNVLSSQRRFAFERPPTFHVSWPVWPSLGLICWHFQEDGRGACHHLTFRLRRHFPRLLWQH